MPLLLLTVEELERVLEVLLLDDLRELAPVGRCVVESREVVSMKEVHVRLHVVLGDLGGNLTHKVSLDRLLKFNNNIISRALLLFTNRCSDLLQQLSQHCFLKWRVLNDLA